MKATGIVRRVDELGRIVVPKEIRRTLRIKEGTPLEIYTDDSGSVVLKKYSAVNELGSFATECVESLYETIERPVILTDKDEIIAVVGMSKKEYLKKGISLDLEKAIEERKTSLNNKSDGSSLIKLKKEDSSTYVGQIIVPIVSGGDGQGAIVLVNTDTEFSFSLNDVKVAKALANFLSKQIS